jgi:hypothetical protein
VLNGFTNHNLDSQHLYQELAADISQFLVLSFQPDLPLAMYYELAAHLSQIGGVEVSLIWQDSELFNYEESQIAALRIQLNLDQTHDLSTNSGTTVLSVESIDLISQILRHYGNWQVKSQENINNDQICQNNPNQNIDEKVLIPRH